LETPIKPAFLALLLATTFLTPAVAAEIDATSKVYAVIVYPQGAEDTRIATVDIPAGEHLLILDGLSGDVDPQSIRVEGDAGEAIEIRSADSNLVHVTDNEGLAKQRKRIESDTELLQDDLAALDQRAQNIAHRRKLIQDVANSRLTAGTSSEAAVKVDSAELGSLFDLVASRLQALDGKSLEARIKKRKVDEEIADLTIKLEELSPKEVTRTVVSVDLLSRGGARAAFKIKYRIASAGSQPHLRRSFERRFVRYTAGHQALAFVDTSGPDYSDDHRKLGKSGAGSIHHPSCWHDGSTHPVSFRTPLSVRPIFPCPKERIEKVGIGWHDCASRKSRRVATEIDDDSRTGEQR